MTPLEQQLDGHSVIGLDTCVLIYHLEEHKSYSPLTMQLFSSIEAGNCHAVLSTIALMEVTIRPWQLERPDVAEHYETLLINFPHLRIAEVTVDVARLAAQLRGRYNIKTADAIQVATAIVNDATAFVTNDKQLRRLAPLIAVVILDDFV